MLCCAASFIPVGWLWGCDASALHLGAPGNSRWKTWCFLFPSSMHSFLEDGTKIAFFFVLDHSWLNRASPCYNVLGQCWPNMKFGTDLTSSKSSVNSMSPFHEWTTDRTCSVNTASHHSPLKISRWLWVFLKKKFVFFLKINEPLRRLNLMGNEKEGMEHM